MSGVKFQVVVQNEPRPVELRFGDEKDAALVSRWRASNLIREKPAVRDTLEFARLASKRWRYYRRSIDTATSLNEFKSRLARNDRAEISFLLLARADWFASRSALGLAQCRRTFCHHLILEFLAVHPLAVGKTEPVIQGVGSGLLYSLAELAGRLRIPLIWGEATAHSAPFYAKALGVDKVQDHFFISGDGLARCRQAFREKFFGQLRET